MLEESVESCVSVKGSNIQKTHAKCNDASNNLMLRLRFHCSVMVWHYEYCQEGKVLTICVDLEEMCALAIWFVINGKC